MINSIVEKRDGQREGHESSEGTIGPDAARLSFRGKMNRNNTYVELCELGICLTHHSTSNCKLIKYFIYEFFFQEITKKIYISVIYEVPQLVPFIRQSLKWSFPKLF
jgi:hypothetical protein